jgi:hypothetical protein
MLSRFRSKGVLLATLVAVVVGLLAAPTAASAEPQPGARKRGFRLFARALGAMTINRIYCGLASDGRVCVDSTNSSTIGGGFWPKGTVDQYVFNSGMQVAGIISPIDGGPWAGDTVGGFFFDPKGTTEHGEEVQPIYNAANSSDFAIWPDAACVPNGDAEEQVFHPLLRTDPSNAANPNCRRSASQGDVWWMSWEGNPALNAGRTHPLGIVVETRGLGWNFPTGNEDILYFIYTFYNVTAADPAVYGASIRPSIRSILQQKGSEFQQLNNAKFGVTLPTGGYTITNLFAAFAADMDVAEAGSNYSSVNLPFALGYVYDHSFSQPPGWTFDPGIFQAPLFQGSGFVGVKYLKSPTGPGAIQLFSNTINGRPFAGAVNDPRDTKQLYRYLSGTLDPSLGDDPCNTGDPTQTRICFVNNNSPQDMRFFQSSTGLTLAPGEFGSIVVGYIFAAPVKTGGCGTTCDVKPGDARLLSSPALLATSGANTIDSLTGFAGYRDLNNDQIVQQNEMTVVPGSLLGKSLTAQAVFDNLFLLPFAPDPPDFFLIPGDNQVTVLWRPTTSEATGDPFFAIASAAQVPDPQNPATLVPNALYDPNYRGDPTDPGTPYGDIEGYRIYRGRVDNPNELTMLAQFDYKATVMHDFTGQINPTDACAPEVGVTAVCPVAFSPNLKDGTTLTASVDVPLSGDIIQVKSGDRSALGSGSLDTVIASIDTTVSPPDTTFTTIFIPNKAIITKADTLMTGGAARASGGPFPKLSDTGVPFVFVDRTPRNNFRYFYSVVAFDVNSIESGPTSLESQRRTKSTTPVRPASNYVSSGVLSTHIVGGGRTVAGAFVHGNRNMDTIFTQPTLDAVNGTFSGPMPPADGVSLGFVGQFAKEVVAVSGNLSARLLSVTPGQHDMSGCCASGPISFDQTYNFRAYAGTDSFDLSIPVTPDLGVEASGNQLFQALQIDSALAARYGGDNTYRLQAQLTSILPPIGYLGGTGFAAALDEPGFDAGDLAGLGYTAARYNGARWFDGPSPANNETMADPIHEACGTGLTSQCSGTTAFNTPGWTNAGKLSNVDRIYQPIGYTMFNREWRSMEAFTATIRRAADYNVYWGAGGVVDSVIDVTHDVVVPYSGNTSPLGANWAILNNANQAGGAGSDGRTGVLTPLDWFCVRPLRQYQGTSTISPFFPCNTGSIATSSTASLGAIAFAAGANAGANGLVNPQSARNAANIQPGQGFSMYVGGVITFFELAALPAQGTVWSLRDYAGTILGGKGGPAGNQGPYKFIPATRPFNAVDAELVVRYDVVNQVRGVTSTDLTKVHTVPDPYYVTNEFEQSTDNKVIKFVNLPEKAIIRIYSSSGVLVNILEHNTTTFGGEETWNVRNRNNQVVASGVYFYHIEANGPNGSRARRVGRFTVVNFAQ